MKHEWVPVLTRLVALLFIGLWIAGCTHGGNREADGMKRATVAGAPMSKPDASLTETYWKLVRLSGQPAALGAGQRELHLVLASNGDRARGFSWCNRFTGTFERRAGELRFGQLASTGMACLEGMEQEQRFLGALGGTVRYTISGDRLTLFDAAGQPVLAFDAVALR